MLAKFAGYFVTAGIAAGIDLAAFYLLFRLGLGTLPTSVSSWSMAAVVNYVLTSRFIFQRALAWRDFARFVLGASLGLAINASVTVALAALLHVWPPLAKLLGIGVAFLYNFAVNALWVFRKPSPRA